jgi:hypothetical protein
MKLGVTFLRKNCAFNDLWAILFESSIGLTGMTIVYREPLRSIITGHATALTLSPPDSNTISGTDAQKFYKDVPLKYAVKRLSFQHPRRVLKNGVEA